MKNIWTLTITTSLPNVCEDADDLVTTSYAYENFTDARDAMRKALKEFAFSKNSMFDGNGTMVELDFYSSMKEDWEKSNDCDVCDDDSDFLSYKKINYVQDILRQIFEGKDLVPFNEAISYKDGMIKVAMSNNEICIEADYDGRINGYDPNIKTNMLNMTEEKDYYIHLDDMLGQESSSELYIDLRKTELL